MAEDAGEARVRDSSDVELPELPGSKRVSFAAGPEEPCRRSTPSLGGEFLTSSAGGVSEVQQLPYASVVVAWILVVAVVGGSAIHVVERGGRTGASWLDCCFVALNCVTATGLATVDVTALRSASLVLMGAFMQLGAATILSLLPIVLRLRALRAALPHLKLVNGDTSPTASLRGRKRRWCQHEAVTFDLRNYKRVPEWLVEYKALLILQRVILAYHAACYLVYGGLIAAYVARVPSARRAATADVAAAPLPWAAFHALSAFNNVGFSLQRDGFTGFARHPALLYLVMGLVLHGNVLYPPCVRWIIVGLSAAAPRTSNRKVYFRYLLLHGRRLTPCLFSSQQNWLLVAAQVAMFLVQVAVLLSICYRDDGFRGETWWTRFNIAAFQAVNTRHAGMTAVALSGLRASALMLQLLMMYLAPVPFVVALRQSVRVARARPSDEAPRCASLAGTPDAPPRPSAEARRRYAAGRRLSLGPSGASPLHDGERARGRAASEAPSLDDAMIDTRELLMERYPDAAPPWRARVALRAAALRFHVRAFARAVATSTGFVRDAAFLFSAWFLIAAIMRYEGDGGRTAASGEAAMGGSGALFYIVFELTSAFGNVGLSLGSIADPSRPTSYSGDLTAAALLIVCAVQIFGRTRDMPAAVDSALSLPTVDAADVLRQSLSLDAPENLSEAGRPSDLAATTAASAAAEA